MDNLLVKLIGMGNQIGTTGGASLKESGSSETKQNNFLNVMSKALSGSNNQETLLKQLRDMQETGGPGLALVMSSIAHMLQSMAQPDAGNSAIPQKPADAAQGKEAASLSIPTAEQKEIKGLSGGFAQMNYEALQDILAKTTGGEPQSGSTDPTASETTKSDHVGSEQVKAFQEEIVKLLSSLHIRPELSTEGGKVTFLDKTGMMPVQEGAAGNLGRAFFQEGKDAERELIQTQNTPVTSHLFTKEILEKNALLLQTMVAGGGKSSSENSSKSGTPGDDKGFNGLLEAGEIKAQNIVDASCDPEQGLDNGGNQKSGADAQTLILNAAKKYKERGAEAGETRPKADTEMAPVSSQRSNSEVPQADSFRSNVFQVKDNNMTFEKGSFTSFVTDRIEKIVEQFSVKSSQMDMVVRLKLDDTETLLVGLKHEGQKVIVDVKASNDGLANLVQAHKDDIARHLEDKNIFTNIFVQPDGEKNFQRQNRKDQNKEDTKHEASTSFVGILEATA